MLYEDEIVCFMLFFFFFQAEDGIRDYKVTGVQTCALPIWPVMMSLISTQTLLTHIKLPKKSQVLERLNIGVLPLQLAKFNVDRTMFIYIFILSMRNYFLV